MFEHRGIVEGFYGPPWQHSDRLHVVEQLGAMGMNRYVYAPKEDPLHRARWAEPYGNEALERFRELVRAGEDAGVQVGYAISPGVSIVYSDPAQRACLRDKLRGFVDLGMRFISLALDDVPSALQHDADREAFASLADAHFALASELHEALADAVTLWLVPTDYLGTRATDYLKRLGELDPAIEIGWTGRTIVSPTIPARDAAPIAKALRRRLLLWDNTPVSDGPMRSMLHAGPYLGRDPDLAEHASGVLLNPMEHARASLFCVSTAAEYLADPRGYDPESAGQRAIARQAGGAAEAMERFLAAHRFSALDPRGGDRELEAAVDGVEAELGADSVAVLEALLEARQAAAPALRESLADARLLAELGPWLESFAREVRRMRQACRMLRALCEAPERSSWAHAWMASEGGLTLDPAPPRSSFGPRRAFYPQLVSMRDDEMGFADDPALYLDCCLTDRLTRIATRHAAQRLGARIARAESAEGTPDTSPGKCG